ncbi:MAG: PA14 domain-containing protein [Polyangiales bacterium]
MSWKDALTLRAAMARAKARSPEVLRENQQAVQLMKQRASAAEALWAGSHAAEGLAMARDAYEAASAAVTTVLGGRPVPAAEGDPGPARGRAGLFKDAGVRAADVAKAEDAYRAERPLLDDDVSVTDARHVKALLKVVRAVERALADDVRSPGSVTAGRLRRALGVLLLVGAGVAIGLFWARERAREADAAWIARYYARANFMGEPQRRNEEEIRFNWGRRSPMVGIPIDGFSARFDTCLTVSDNQVVRVGSGSDDGARVFIDGEEVLDNWGSQAYSWKNARVELDAGSHHIRVEFFEGDGDAGIQVQFRDDDDEELRTGFSRPTAPDDGCGEPAESRVLERGTGRSRRGSSRMNSSPMTASPMTASPMSPALMNQPANPPAAVPTSQMEPTRPNVTQMNEGPAQMAEDPNPNME